MDFVFMLTRNDATVENALALVEIARPLGLRHIGFKDVGANASVLQSARPQAIRAAGAAAWMEVVSTTGARPNCAAWSLAATSGSTC